MNQKRFVTRRIFLLWVALLLAAATGCAPVQTKSTGGQAEPTSISEGKTEAREGITQEYLQAMLMDFADTYLAKYGGATTELIKQVSSPDRITVARLRFYWIYSAVLIASDRNARINLVNMVIFVTLTRVVWEEYWQPELFGDSALVVVKTLRDLEETIWTLAAKVLTPEQQEELRTLIQEWRKKNPDQHYVGFIRLSNILELVDKDSFIHKETQPGGLLAPIKEATKAVDEIRFSTERAMYQASRMQLLLDFEAEVTYHDLANQPEIRQLLSDITDFRETVERLPAQISDERKNIMRDLGSQEKSIQNVVTDIRETMKEGNDLISSVNETTKTVDTVFARIYTMLRTPATGRPFDIMDYHNTMVVVSDALKQANLVLDSMDELLTSADWEQRMPVLLRLADRVESKGEELVTQIFIYGVALILIFFLALFLTMVAYQRVIRPTKE